MDSILASSTFINPECSDIRQSTSKVLAWLEDNLSTLNRSCECCKSKTSCSFHATSCLAVRGKVLEDRLVKLNKRRESLEQRNELLDEKRRQVIEMALRIRNMSGSSLGALDSVNPSGMMTREHGIPDVVPRLLEQPGTSFTDIHVVNQEEETVKSRTGLKLKSVLKKMSSIVRSNPDVKSITTQTSSSLLTGLVSSKCDDITSKCDDIISKSADITSQSEDITQQSDVSRCQDDTSASDIDLITQYTKEGLKCTWC